MYFKILSLIIKSCLIKYRVTTLFLISYLICWLEQLKIREKVWLHTDRNGFSGQNCRNIPHLLSGGRCQCCVQDSEEKQEILDRNYGGQQLQLWYQQSGRQLSVWPDARLHQQLSGGGGPAAVQVESRDRDQYDDSTSTKLTLLLLLGPTWTWTGPTCSEPPLSSTPAR